MNSIKFLEFKLNGKMVICDNNADVLIQVGKGKGSYKTRWTFKAYEINLALISYKGINIGNGYKKRLVIPSLNKPILHKIRS